MRNEQSRGGYRRRCPMRLWSLMMWGIAVSIPAQTVVRDGHLDLGVGWEGEVLELHWHVHEPEPDGTTYQPEELLVEIGPTALWLVPPDPRYAFLGPVGAEVYLLPATEDPSLPFLGLSAEEIPLGLFEGNEVRLTLLGMSGPGQFALFAVDPFGNPNVFMQTTDGIGGGDAYVLRAGTHAHVHWAFTAPGAYALTFEASGERVGGGLLRSDPATFSFVVVPEPWMGSLWILGAALWFSWRRSRR